MFLVRILFKLGGSKYISLPLKGLKTNDQVSFKNAAISTSEYTADNETMTARSFISPISLGYDMFACYRKGFLK